MAKNMTRKGLALGSTAALIAAGLAGATPAFAADITFDASYGTSGATQNGLLGKTFNLAATSSAVSTTLFYVTGVDETQLTVSYRDVTDLDTTEADTAYDETASVTDKGTATAPAVVVDLDGGTGTWATGEYAQMLFGLTGVDETTTITITPFNDTVVSDGKISTNEDTGTTITLTFHKPSEVTATTEITTPVIGTNTLTATVTLDKDINSAALPANSVDVWFAVDDDPAVPSTSADVTGRAPIANVSWNDDDGVWDAESATLTPVINDSSVYAAQARVSGAAAGGNIDYASASSGVADSIDKPVVKASALSRMEDVDNGQVKAGSGSVTIYAEVTPVTGEDAEGQTVTFKFTKSSLRKAASISVGGKTLTSADTSISVEAETDADGIASVEVAYTGFATTTTADAVDVEVSVLGETVLKTAGPVTVTAVDATATALVDVATVGTNAVRAIAKGGTVSLDLQLVDQFGTAIAADRRFVYSIANESSVNVEVSVPSSQATTTGSATVNVTDVSTATSGTFELHVLVQKKDTNGFWVTDTAVNAAAAKVTSFVMGQAAAATLTTTAAMDTDDTGIVLQTVAMVENDGRKLALSEAPYTDNKFTVTGKVRAANGVLLKGQAVTVSAAGVGFSSNGVNAASVFTVDSITVYTDANGDYSVDAFSNKAGLIDFTVTSGAASKETTGYFADALPTAGKTLTIDAPAAVAPGSTLTVKAMLVDKFGNPVDATKTTHSVAIAYDGPGLQVNTPTDFVDGALQFGVLLGSNDSGTATITISVYTGTSKISVQKTVVVGTVGNVGAYSSWTKKLDDNSAKMYAKNVVGEGKVQFFLNGEEIAWVRAVDATDPKLRTANGSAYLVRTVEFKDGKNVLEIYVDGVRTTRTAYTK